MNKNPEKPQNIDKIISKLFNKNPQLPKHKQIEKEISKMLEGRR